MKISVIIPVFKDWDRLKLTLEALKDQSLSKKYFEILIVNNGDHSDIPKGFVIPENSKILHETKPGSYAARNLGVKYSTGEFLAFTDSDCIPDSKWLENAMKCFDDENLDRLGGAISIFCNNETNRTSAELYDVIFAFQQKKAVNKLGYSVTANLFVRKSSFIKVGFFNSNLFSGGDHEWNMRAKSKGLSIEYRPEVIVNHPARFDIKGLVQKHRRVIGSWQLPSSIIGKWRKYIYMFLANFIKPIIKVILTDKITFKDKFKVIKVVFTLFKAKIFEFNRLLRGGTPLRQ